MGAPHAVLGVARDADQGAIVDAYRERVKKAHPDQGGSFEEFRAVQSAYEALTDDATSAFDPTRETTGPDRRVRSARVDYLNYRVLENRGWGLTDDDLFEKASRAGFDPVDHGRIAVEPGESLLEAAENRGFSWPFACRGGACANCAVAVLDGELSQPVNHILPPELVDRGVRLSCMGAPITRDLRVVYNVERHPALRDLRLPPMPFKWAKRTK